MTIRSKLFALLVALAAAGSVVLTLLPTQYVERVPLDLFDREPADGMLAQRLTGGPITPASYREAVRQSRRIGRQTAAAYPSLASRRWRLEGPTNIGGRIVDLVVDPKIEKTIYVAAASGGIWKSTDVATTFKPVWPKGKVQAMGSIAIAPDATLYAGTGEPNPGGGSITFGGNGIYRSTDRGRSWKNIGLRNSSAVAEIVIDPKNPKRILAAAAGNLYKAGGQRGLYQSLDGGRTWKLILAPENDTSGAVDIALDPKNPKRIFVVMWEHLRQPDLRTYGGLGSGIYYSEDSGKSWSRLGPTNGLPPPSTETGRIGIAIAPSDPTRMYAIYINKSGTYEAFYTSSDSGQLWSLAPQAGTGLAASQFTYGWWFGRIWVDPRDPMLVWVAGVSLSRSTNGGQSFSNVGGVHADQHGMAWDPHKRNRVYLGNDGGTYRSDDNGSTWIFARYQPYTQFYGLDVSEQDPRRIAGGTQDNGSIRSWGGADWNDYYGGDGQKNLINPKDKNNVFACLQYGDCVRSDDGGNSQQSMNTVSDRYNWHTPIEFDPSNTDIVYTAGNIVNRSTDRGRNFTPISPDLSGGPGRETNPLFRNYGTVTTLGVAKTDGNVIWAGTDDGRVWRTTDGGTIWTRIEHDALPTRWVTRVAIHPRNANKVFLTFSGYREGLQKPHVVMTADGGENWKNITGNLPNAPTNDVIVAGRKLFLASDVGVFTTRIGSTKWKRVGRGLPMAPITDIRWHESTRTLYAATFGRSIWSVRL